MKATLFCELYEIMHSNEGFMLLGSMQVHSEFEKIQHTFPQRFIDTSTCQHSALSIAMSLINKGFVVILCISIPQFMVRWYEDLLKTIGFKSIPLIIVGLKQNTAFESPASLQFGPEIMLAYTIPALNIIAPSNPGEIGTLLAQACKIKRPVYIHFERDVEVEVAVSTTLPQLFEPIQYSYGTQAICIGIGSALDKAYQAKVLLESYGYSTSLISMHTLKPLNHIFLRKILHAYSAVFTFEDQDTALGIGKLIGCFVAENKMRKIIFKSFGGHIPTQNKGILIGPSAQKQLNMQAAGLELLELLINSGIIPDHESWNIKK